MFDKLQEHLNDTAPCNSRFDGYDRGDSGRDFDDDYLEGETEGTLVVTPIGKVYSRDDGADEYILVRNPEDDITEEQFIAQVFWRYYRESSYPGDYFCTNYQWIANPIHTDRAIVVIYHSRDI